MVDAGRGRDVGDRRPDSPDGCGLERWLGRGSVALRRLDSGLRRNGGLETPAGGRIWPVVEGRHPDRPDGCGLARRLGRGSVALRRLDSGLRRNDEVGGGGYDGLKAAGRRGGGMWLVSEGTRPDRPDGCGLARWLGQGVVALRRLDSGLRRNDGLEVPAGGGIWPVV